jgi:hypothetical protein
VLHDLIFIGRADGRTTVREKDDDKRAILFAVRAECERPGERVINGSAAEGF